MFTEFTFISLVPLKLETLSIIIVVGLLDHSSQYYRLSWIQLACLTKCSGITCLYYYKQTMVGSGSHIFVGTTCHEGKSIRGWLELAVLKATCGPCKLVVLKEWTLKRGTK